jgi:formylglycine-generating enzyme required for sulfatase activity/predicted Ser/Thr protein kinase
MGNDDGGDRDFDFEPTLQGGEGDDGLLAGRYRIVRPLGEGGMGTVYLAKDEKLDDLLMAVKMLPTYLARNRRAMDSLKREARITMGLSHPNIVTLRNFEEMGDGVFLVMDYVDGQTLDDFLAENEKLPEDKVVELFTPIAEALAYAHSKNVIHRDIKPGNILIATDGTPRLADFGVAREVKDTVTRVTGKADTSGTLSYMSPEQLDGDEPTPQQDIYSLAATVYECLCGHPPFHRGDIHRQIVSKTPSPPTGSESAVETTVMRCLAKKPEERIASCGELVEAIRADVVVPSKSVKDKAIAIPDEPMRAISSVVMTPPKRFTSVIGMKFKLIPAGEFVMGSPESEDYHQDDEKQHRVCITKPFYLGVHGVTQGEFEKVMGKTPWTGEGDVEDGSDYAASYISWDDAVEFCKELSAREGRTYRLPTEAEWEYACRAGSKTAYCFGNDSSQLDEYAWYDDNAGGADERYAHQIGQKKPNAWGLFDMHGNVWEWCQDWSAYEYYENSPINDPEDPSSGVGRVIRGGCWDSYAAGCRSASRDGGVRGDRSIIFGFRVALVPSK